MSLVKDFLKQKEQDYSKYIPESYKLTKEQKQRQLFVQNSESKYMLEAAARCMKPCWTHMTTAMVTESESECMTNCVGKSMETLESLKLFQVSGQH